MRTQRTAAAIATLLVALVAPAPWAGTLNGTVKVGGVFLDEEGDRSTVQETFNIEEGFAVSQLYLTGLLDSRSSFILDLRDLNLDSRQGELIYRVPGRFRLSADYDHHRQVFDPGRGVTSERQEWGLGARLTPNRWLGLTGQFDLVAREGDRLAFPAGTASALGDRYDNALKTGVVSADVHSRGRGGAVSYQMSEFTDDLDGAADRRGRVVSARLYAPTPFYTRWTNLLRGAYGTREVEASGTEYTLASLQYTAVVEPREAFQLRYRWDGRRIDDESTGLKTDRFQNDLDATYLHRLGRIQAGYGYEMNDDDRSLTSYQSWRAGAAFRVEKRLSAKVDYASRVKKDEEELTLLKDVEASRIRARLEVHPLDRVTLGGDYGKRERDLPDIDVTVDGTVAGGFVRYEHKGWGSLSADYSFSADDYRDRLAGFETESHFVTGRVEIERIRNVRLAGGVTYMDVGKDLDIEKSTVFVEGGLRLMRDYRLEAKYNVYNYDDYILIDRYYTANVVRIDLAYDLHR